MHSKAVYISPEAVMNFKKEEIIYDRNIPFAMYETNARQVMIHCHDCLEINLILKGGGQYLIEEQSYPISDHDIFIINNLEHHMAVHEGNLSMLVFLFDPAFVFRNPEEYEYLSPFFDRGIRFSNMVDQNSPLYPRMREHLEKLAQEYETMEEGWELAVKANLLMFLACLNRYYYHQNALFTDNAQTRGYSRIRSVIAYIHQNFQQDLTLTALAKQAAMSKSYFSSFFTKIMKMSVSEYIAHVRINHAMLLLQSTSDSVLDIALDSGFHSSAYFNRIFKKFMQMTPNEYRKSKNRTMIAQ